MPPMVATTGGGKGENYVAVFPQHQSNTVRQ